MPLTAVPLLFTALLSFQVSIYIAQSSDASTVKYIAKHRHLAVRQMESSGIPASVILAQAIFESGCGASELAKRSNNHFGIKCQNTWQGDTVRKTDDAQNECFRKYRSVEDSYRDHSIFLQTRKWYVPLFRLPLTDYKGWCKGLKQAGYATYPTYAEELIRIIEQFRLYELDAAERLTPVTDIVCDRSIRPEKNIGPSARLEELAYHDLLFSDERHIVVRSIAMIGEHSAPRIMASR